MDSNLVQQIIDIIASCASVDIVSNLDYIVTAVEHAIALIGLAEESVELPWTVTVTDALYALAADLDSIRIVLENEEQQRRGKRVGRPECHIPRQSLEELLELRFTAKEIAKIYHVCRMTVCRKMKKYNLSVGNTYAAITDEQLEEEICTILLAHPYTGYKRMLGFLASKGLRVTERRVRDCMKLVDPLGVAERTARNRAIYRRSYFVRHAMERWHLDTNMKLTRRYKFIIRSCIDGNTRCCIYLHIGTENSGRSNLTSFMAGIREWGLPLSVRCDKGGENWLIARFMLTVRGLHSRAVLTGRSVHNQRIERFWVDVYRDTQFYYETFRGMEEKGILDIDNPNHLFILHQVYLPRIQSGFDEFKRGWNHHKVTTERNKTPLQLMILNRRPAQEDAAENMENIEHAYADTVAQDDHHEEYNPVRNPAPTHHTLNAEQLQTLYEMDFMRSSDSNGEDIFVEALTRVGLL